MQMNDMILISVDDHIVEPPDLFDGRVPKRFAGRFPENVKGAAGEDVWLFEGKPIPNVALNAVAGRRPEEYGFEPTAYSQLRKGCYDVDARVDDMNANGVLASLNFPSFVGLGGMLLDRAQDKELALAVLQAWNDWHIEDWCGRHPGRFIPLALVPLWDAKLAGDEVRRVSQKGCHAINFVPNPSSIGRPSLHSETWDPLWQACNDEGTTICLHISDASGTVPSLDTPVDAFIANMPVTLYATASDLTYSPILRKFPDIKFALSEGGTGWIPHFLERVDWVYGRHRAWTHQDFGGKRPSQVFLDHVYTCFIHDEAGIQARHAAGLRNMSWESDYPHSDTTWPRSPEMLWESLRSLPDAEIALITHENAMRAYHFDPFAHVPREQATVGALRAQAKHVDLGYTETAGAGRPPREPGAGPITFADVAKQLAQQSIPMKG